MDFREEIKKYSKIDSLELDFKEGFSYLEFTNDINNFTKRAEKLDKLEHYGNEICENNREFQKLLKDRVEITLKERDGEILTLKRKINTLEAREKSFLKAILKILDSIEWFQKIIKVFSNSSVEKSLFTTNKVIKKELLNMDIIQIDTIGESFNDKVHNCIEVVEDEKRNNNEIIDVVKNGYIYRGEVVRVAEVIVVKNKGGEEFWGK